MPRPAPPVCLPPRPSPVVQFIPIDPYAFKLDVEMCDEVGTVACVTSLLERHGIYLEWLRFGVVDPDESLVKLRLKARGTPREVAWIADLVARGLTFDDLARFQAAASGQPIDEVPMHKQHRLGISVECLDRPFLCAELSRIPFPFNGTFHRISMQTTNSTNLAPECGAAGFVFEGEVRCATLKQQNHVVYKVMEWVEAQVRDDPEDSPRTKVVLTDLRLGVTLPDRRPGRLRLG